MLPEPALPILPAFPTLPVPPGVAPEPPAAVLVLPAALFPLPELPPAGLVPLLSVELQATERHTAQAPNSDNSSLVMIRFQDKKRRALRHSIDK